MYHCFLRRTSKDSEVPSIVLRHAPDTCKIYVVSAKKIISNSLNPMSTSGILMIMCLHCLIYFATLTGLIGISTGRECDSRSLALSSSSSESKFQNCLSDVTRIYSHSRTPTFSSVNSDFVSETSHQASEESLSDMSRDQRFLSVSSVYAEQVTAF